MRPGWFLDELATAGRENLDPEHVARYDTKEDAGATAEVALLRTLGLAETDTVLELGPGTGQFTAAVAPHCGRVIAVDVSAPMLERLRTATAELTNVELVHGGFLSYAHAGDPVDVAYSRLALHHLPDFWKVIALQRLRGVMRPGGLLRLVDVVYAFEPATAEVGIEAWCATGGADATSEWTRAELEEHVRDEHSTFTWLLEATLARTGFAIEDAVSSTDGVFAAYVVRAV